MSDRKPSTGPQFALVGDSAARAKATQRIRWGQLPEGVSEIPTNEAARHLGDAASAIRSQLSRRIVGMEGVIEHLLIGLFSGGHCLLVGVPGLAKTLLIRSLSELLSLDFTRIQFTPDLMPSDITGTEVLIENRSTGTRTYQFLKGPIFTNVLLADEINRTPPKTQSALLEAMEEGQVTSVGDKHQMDQPFFVLATQNPIEQEGTYPLPVSQMDRFMFFIWVDYPTEAQEHQIVRMTISRPPRPLESVLDRSRILQLIQAVRSLPTEHQITDYAIALTRAARPCMAPPDSEIREWVQWGPGPRGTQHLILGAKARALLHGRQRVLPEDVRAVLPAIFRHRVLMNYHAEVDGVTAEEVIRYLLDAVPAPDRRAVARPFVLDRYVKSS